MTAQEMLIEVNTSLQAIGASRTRKYYPEEIEWYLNKMQNRFVQNSLRKKGSDATGYMRSEGDANTFEVNEMYRDAIKAILVESYLPADYGLNAVPTKASVWLPSDYSYALDIGVCAQLCTTWRGNKLLPAPIYIYIIPYPPDSTDGGGNYFDSLSVTMNGDQIISFNGHFQYPAAFQLIEAISGVYNRVDGSIIEIAPDNIGTYVKPGYIILKSPVIADFELNYESTSNAFTGDTEVDTLSTQVNEEDAGPVNLPSRSVNNSNTFSTSTTPYYKTSNKEVTLKINGSVIYLDTATNFIVNGIIISYVRKPRRISVSLNIGSEIAPEFHDQICDMTVQHIRERIGDPKFQTGIIDYKQA